MPVSLWHHRSQTHGSILIGTMSVMFLVESENDDFNQTINTYELRPKFAHFERRPVASNGTCI